MAPRLRPLLYLGLPPDARMACRVLDAAAMVYDGVDVAPYYCHGEALAVVRQVKPPITLRLTTRVPVVPGAATTWQGPFPPRFITSSVSEQLDRSGRDKFDTVLLQTWLPSWDAAPLVELREVSAAGFTDSVGVSIPDSGELTDAPEELRQSKEHMLQVDASILRPHLVTAASAAGVSAHIQVRAPFFHGILARLVQDWAAPRDPQRERLFAQIGWSNLEDASSQVGRHAEALGVPAPVLALAFVLQHERCHSVVVGASSPAQAVANVEFFAQAWDLAISGTALRIVTHS